MVVMKGRFGKPVLAIVEALTHVEPSLSCCMALDPLVGAWTPHASFSHLASVLQPLARVKFGQKAREVARRRTRATRLFVSLLQGVALPHNSRNR